jgi:hypothetical protein
MLFDHWAEKSAADMDKLKAASNESKAAFEEKDGAVKSLTQKISDLEYKETSLTNASREELKPVLLELKSQFGSLGFQADMVNDT